MRDIMKQVDANLAIQVPDHSTHNLDRQTLTTMNFGTLCPVLCMETVPGATYYITPETLVRFQPLNSPLMHKCDMKIMLFHVPNRLVWDNWENFLMGKVDPQTGLNPVKPYYLPSSIANNAVNGVSAHRLIDYFGIKSKLANAHTASTQKLCPMPLAAYQKIWNRYFRHKAVRDEIQADLTDGLISSTLFNRIVSMRKITYEDDYYNAALPTPQKGDAAYIDDDAPVYRNAGTATPSNYRFLASDSGLFDKLTSEVPNSVGTNNLYAEVKITMEEIRRVAAAQKIAEISMHTGDIIDYYKAFYNVDFPDSRARQPEYIGGVSQPVTISDVMNTADDFQGRLVGNGTGYAKGDGCKYYAYEHGFIIGIAVCTYRSLYTKAIPKFHFKNNRFDYFNPQFDGLGEQAITRVEVNGLGSGDELEFGYVPRHHDYRATFDLVTGEMATTYSNWHLGRDYAGIFGLSADFYDVIDQRRAFAYTGLDYDPIIVQAYFDIRATLPMGQLPERSM